MVFTTWAEVLSQSFQSLFYGLVAFVPNLVVAIVIFIVGWLVGAGPGRVVAQSVTSLRVDPAFKATGIEQVLSSSAYGFPPGNVPRLPVE